MFSLYSWLSLAWVQLNTAVHRSLPQSSDARRASPFASIGRAELSPSGSTISEKNKTSYGFFTDGHVKWMVVHVTKATSDTFEKKNIARGQWSIGGLTKTKLSLIWITNSVCLNRGNNIKIVWRSRKHLNLKTSNVPGHYSLRYRQCTNQMNFTR